MSRRGGPITSKLTRARLRASIFQSRPDNGIRDKCQGRG
nr:MAG TPA: hypothetical protein [Caudoviricetes sp.]